MTRLYRLDACAREIADAFGARAGDDPWNGDYVAPGRFAPVITAGRDFIAGPRSSSEAIAQTRNVTRSSSEVVAQTRILPRFWGVLPPPNTDDPGRRIASVRNSGSPFWIGNLRNSEFRCLIPATAVMIWGSGIDHEGRRLKHWLGLPGAVSRTPPLFAMLGVWKDEEIPAFALVTHPPTGLARELGAANMPVIVPPRSDSAQIWLDGGWDRAQTVLHSANPGGLCEIAPPAA